MRIALVGYRKWSLDMFWQLAWAFDKKRLEEFTDIDFSGNANAGRIVGIISSEKKCEDEMTRNLALENKDCYGIEVSLLRDEKEDLLEALDKLTPDVAIFVGWSNIIGKEVLDKYKCLCIHPSKLPLFRGGSPIQNQILNGVTESAVTLFEMDEGMDSGKIWGQSPLSLKGTISDILGGIKETSFHLILECLQKYSKSELIPVEQDESKATYYKRRMPEHSEITIWDLQSQEGEYLFNKIRALGNPYPNAFIRTSDGKRLFITEAHLEGKKE